MLLNSFKCVIFKLIWNQANNQTHAWTNDRESTWGYDPDGRLKFTPENYYAYNAAGAVMRSSLTNVNLIYHHTDGEGRSVRRDIYKQTNGYNTFEKTEYSIYSSVLGKALTDVKSDGAKKKTNVYGAGGQLVATQNAASTTLQHVAWNNIDPSSASYLPATHTGRPVYLGDDGQAELDPLGSNVQTSNPFDQNRSSNLMQIPGGGGGWGDPFGGYSCMVDWVSQPCSFAAQVLGSGAGYIHGVDVPSGIPGKWKDIDNPHRPPGLPKDVIWSGTISVFEPFATALMSSFQQQQIREVRLSGDVKLGRKVTPRSLLVHPCDEILTKIFGNKNSLTAGSGYEIRNGVYHDRMSEAERADSNIREKIGMSLPHTYGYATHSFARSNTQSFGYVNGDIYIPAGYTDWSPFTNDGAWFYNSKTGTTILVMHVDPNKVSANLRRNVKNDAGSILIGQMTNGGGVPGYIHAHTEAHRGRGVPNADLKKFPDFFDRQIENQRLRDATRLFFRDIFCP